MVELGLIYQRNSEIEKGITTLNEALVIAKEGNYQT